VFISSTTYTARTGVLDFPFTYTCGRCGTSAAALVRAEGTGKAVRLYGVGDGAADARRVAALTAQTQATRAIMSAACPCCGALQQALMGEHQRAQATLARRLKLRIPIALGLALLAGGLLVVPAVRDLAYSSGLLFTALGLALGLGGLVFAIFSRRENVTRPNTGSVWFWWTVPSHEGAYRAGPPEAAWMPPPPPAFVPRVDQPAGWPLALGILATLTGVVLAFGGLIAWGASSETVYVASSEPGGAALTVRVDGEEVAQVAASSKTRDDVGWERISIRHGATRTVEITSPSGGRWQYALDPKAAKNGWLLAPDAMKHGLCLVGSKVVYGKSAAVAPSSDDDDELLNKGSEGPIALSRSYDYLFSEAPKSISMDKNAQSAVRWELRALDCGKLAEDEIVGFRAAQATAPATASAARKGS
jgi:hypothetical protein